MGADNRFRAQEEALDEVYQLRKDVELYKKRLERIEEVCLDRGDCEGYDSKVMKRVLDKIVDIAVGRR